MLVVLAAPVYADTDPFVLLGVRAGYAERAAEIADKLQTRAPSLDRAFDFARYTVDQQLPPVVELTSDATLLENAGSLTSSSVSIRVVEEARLVIEPPTWRDYLFLPSGELSMSDRTLLTQVKRRQRPAFNEGVALGRAHADQAFDLNMVRLTSTLRGMRLARDLIARGVLKPAEMNVNGAEVQWSPKSVELAVIRRTLEGDAQFKQAQDWRPIIRRYGKP